MKVYVLKNCDTCRKALAWLDGQQLDYECLDIRKDGLAREDVDLIVATAGADKAVNKRSTTWRTLPDTEQARLGGDAVKDADVVDLLLEHPTLLKRPAFISGLNAYVGFDEGTKVILSQA